MANVLKFRRGTRAQNVVFTGQEAELSYDSTAKSMRVHDGVTPGGFLFSKNTVSVTDFGATGNGATNDTPFIQAALDSGAKRVYFPKPTSAYSCGTLVIPGGIELYGDGSASVIRQDIAPSNGQGLLFLNSGSSSAQLSNIKIHDLQLKGLVSTLAFNEFQHLISFNGVNNCQIYNCLITGFRGDGIYIGSGDLSGQERHNSAVQIFNNYIDGENKDNRNGVSVIDGADILIDGNTFINCTRSNMPGAIDFEPDVNVYHRMNNCRVTNNHFKNIGGNVGTIAIAMGSVVLTVPPSGFTITGNTFDVGTPPIYCKVNSGNTGLINLIFANNSGIGARPFNLLGYINGVTYENNNFTFSATGLIGFSGADAGKNININNNTFYNGAGSAIDCISVFNATNLNIGGNIFSNSATCINLGFSSTAGGSINECNITSNNFNTSTTGIVVGANSATAQNINIDSNMFTSLSSGIILGVSSATISSVNINGNTFDSINNSIQYGAIGITSLTNVKASNNNFTSVVRKSNVLAASAIDFSTLTWSCNKGDGTVDAQFWVTDDCGTIVNGNTAVSFNSATLPDSFPVGTSVAVINGDTGVPNGGGSHQGILTTYRYTDTVGYEKFTYQTFYAASNTAKDGAFWTRKRDDVSDTWLAWYEHTGV